MIGSKSIRITSRIGQHTVSCSSNPSWGTLRFSDSCTAGGLDTTVEGAGSIISLRSAPRAPCPCDTGVKSSPPSDDPVLFEDDWASRGWFGNGWYPRRRCKLATSITVTYSCCQSRDSSHHKIEIRNGKHDLQFTSRRSEWYMCS